MDDTSNYWPERERADSYPGAIPPGARGIISGQPQAQTSTVQQPDSSSVGQKIMNTASSDSGSSSTQPVIGALPGMESYNQAAMGKIVGSLTDSARQWLGNQAQKERQVNQQARVPVDRHDPKYRMGIGQRILGSLVNFGSGFSNSHLPTVYVGPGAVNRRYYQDQQQREDDAAASDSWLETLDSARTRDEQLHNQLMNPKSGSTQNVSTNTQRTDATANESAPSGPQSPQKQLTLYDRAVMQAAQEGDPEKATEWDKGLRMMERIQQGRERGTIKPAATATDGLTQSEMKLYNDQVYGVNQRIGALEKAERTPEIDAALQKFYQQRDAIANGIKARRPRVQTYR
ncbi:MAG TPA: hypothetical protein VG649_11710 [Candidatus Angelobacter sp.]|jgi:hypothetical protein|nr:hypothetical protein [Candidatus Angelobacter sp.]